MFVRGARIVQDGQIQFVDRAFDVRFACVNERAYQRYTASVHKRYGLESRKPAFVQKRQQHGLHDVVGVMSEGEFIESQLDRLIVKRATAHLAAQTARITFFPCLEDDFGNIGVDDVIRHAEFRNIRRQSLFFGDRRVLKAHVDSDCGKVEFRGRKALKGF